MENGKGLGVNLQHLATFCRVVETGSFRRAASSLSLTQPAVSKHVRAMETAFGTRLLERGRLGTRPNRHGVVAYRYALRILETWAHCGRAMERVRDC